MVDLAKISKRWQKKWKEAGIFDSDADLNGRKKFFVTFPYPYVNGHLHVGHSYTLMRVEAFARYKRMQGFNVLFPQGWHATGAPIDTAAKRVKEGEQKQIEILKTMGFTEEEIKNFEDPKHWVKTFSKAAEQDFRSFGISVDWRRNFITTELNPRYSKFIQWQFKKLKQRNLVIKGEHPVVWCPKENTPVGDHARAEGEGEVPEEMVLIKFKIDDLVLPAATFRPETTYGVTNMWLNPEIAYVEANVDNEKWLVTEQTLKKLEDQKHKVSIIRKTSGKEFIGKKCRNPANNSYVTILPASFVSAENGTGVVMSVPSHAPYDWIALKEIIDGPEKFGLAQEIVKDIKPVSLIKVKDYGEHPAIEICEKLGINSQTEDAKLEEATKEIYKKEFHTGILKEITGKYQGLSVQEAKAKIIADFAKEGIAALMYDLARRVICRCLSRCHVKIVDDQWFLNYSNPEWKQSTMKALSECKLYPEKVRGQFEYVIDWLKDWACTREFGLGTKLPWDKKWVIESLSDSTIYMAFYTIAHLLKEIPASKATEKLFDYVFLGQGTAEDTGVDKNLADRMRNEFNYWYPVDFRNSGKDLVQNHLAFFIFNHTAIFPEKQWPKGIGVNGFVSIEKMKMSKSKGNFRTLRELVQAFTPDVTRISILGTGEELSDVDWDPDFAFNIKNRLEQWYNFAVENYNSGSDEKGEIDSWMESQLNRIITESTTAMEQTLFRTAIMKGFFELQRALKWYIRRKAGKQNKALINQIIEAQTKMLTPFTPHICEEIWSTLGKSNFISTESWPACDASKINLALEASEAVIENSLEDISSVIKLSKLAKPGKITLFVAEDWKFLLLKKLKEMLSTTRNPGELIKAGVSAVPKEKAGDVANIVNRVVRDPSKIPAVVSHQESEFKFFQDSIEFLVKEFGCEIKIVKEQDSDQTKARQAMPGKPAILVE